MATTTLGVKVDEALKERLKLVAGKLGCTPHWLHKQALLSYVEAIERGHIPDEISHLDDASVDAVDDSGLTGPLPPFFEFAQEVRHQSVLRAAVTAAYRRPETECISGLIDLARSASPKEVQALAGRLVQSLRDKQDAGIVDGLIQEFSLSSQEGVALMCLAEALLRIPDRPTRDALIRDKISHGDWKSHMGESRSLVVNAATWGLVLTGKLVSVNSEQTLSKALTRLIGKGGEPLVRKGVNIAMRMMGEQFVSGQTISSAIANGKKIEEQGFRHSYDMLGEAATTAEDAQRYYQSYQQAIHAIGKASQGRGIYEGPGISIKLSALHPRYSRAQRDRVMSELLPRMTELARLARSYDIGVNIDAEEADRLELSLDLLEALCFDPDLRGWHGVGFVVQAYQKRAPFVVDYLIDLARRSERRIMVRLVKGAYWDSEIKRAQVDGLEGYPVYTRKIHTDVSYLACARKLLEAPQSVYAQFATHNAHTVAAIYYMAGQNYYPGQYEFQCLHGMGEPLYKEIVGSVADGKLGRPCRIYAPVGTHETLLAYLVRRLLENGANTSFVNQIADESISVDRLVADPVQQVEAIRPLGAPHDKIVLPRQLYQQTGQRLNSAGLDLSNEHRLGSLSAALLNSVGREWSARPTVGANPTPDMSRAVPVLNPADNRDCVGQALEATENDVEIALIAAQRAAPIWQATPVQERAACLIRAAQFLEDDMQVLLGLIVREAGKSLPNAIAEVREAVDFLRYYARQIERDFSNDTHRPLGPVVCISPWNFPMAIFTGQVAAALAAGNTVLAKPAEQTSLIASAAVDVLHRAGVPSEALQLLPGRGETVGAALVGSPLVRGVLFTGSTEVARHIAAALAERLDEEGNPIPLIAETGGQNAMVVDSSALAEQVVADVLTSAFDSAGQRCSALRILCIQDDCADYILTMLRGAMKELAIGRPDLLSTDVGPVIDTDAQAGISKHIKTMREAGYCIDQVELPRDCQYGSFVAPTLIEIPDVSVLSKEVFGPVLHVVRYKRAELDELLSAINAAGYGLTFGVHTRLDETVAFVSARIRVGNVYVNRNIVGAVVGVQPFGGEGLSGTGPKAGGPLYLLRLLARSPSGLPGWCVVANQEIQPMALVGPTGENNSYIVKARGIVLCIAATSTGAQAQFASCKHTGNVCAFLKNEAGQDFYNASSDQDKKHMRLIKADQVASLDFQTALFEGDGDALLAWNREFSQREGPIVSVQGLSTEALVAGESYRLERLLREVSVSVNTAAAGGNASLMMIG
jgi:RHH-type proline utilization regulon transcriptional repressor/proline dehydrogenase/delta 1-pyrroline-5-carboxylate dehydrogenase